MKTLLYVSLAVSVSASLQDGICDLACPNQAPCVFGTVGTSSYMHCNCPSFYTGLQCELNFESCGDSEHVCLHGGTCESGMLDSFGNIQLYCNCDNAIDTTGTTYVGKYCEHPLSPAIQTSCTPQNEDTFCLNGGLCNDKYPGVGQPCLCTNGHTGDRCEYTNGDYSTGINVSNKEQELPSYSNRIDPYNSAQSQCDLRCDNGGVCAFGSPTYDEKPYQFWPPSLSNTMYCQCPDNFDGPSCEIPKAPCGDYHCFNRAFCTVLDDLNGQVLHHCDCSAGFTPTASFAGRFCQYKAEQYCPTNDASSGHLFCVNGGSCKQNAYEGCKCPPGFTGFSCEFRAQVDETTVTNEQQVPLYDSEEHSACDLQCQNGGTCRHGTKQNSKTLDLFAHNTAHLNNQAQTINNEHCVCPDSFTGTYCEHSITECAEGEYLCAHGGRCVEQGNEMLCDCDSADSSLATFFAGTHCEHPVNDICTEGLGAPDTVQFNTALPTVPMSFCVNGGRCMKKVQPGQPHPGCFCMEGYRGPHCELREAAQVPGVNGKPPSVSSMKREGQGSSVLEKAMLSLAIVAILVVGVFSGHTYIRRRRQRNHAITSSINWQQNYRDHQEPEINIAPKRRGSVVSDDEVYEQATIKARRRSSRDPLVAAATRSNNGTVEMVKTELELAEDDSDLGDDKDPEIYIGPPRDEDGHELHNVEIV